jgi:hypothetical protein
MFEPQPEAMKEFTETIGDILSGKAPDTLPLRPRAGRLAMMKEIKSAQDRASVWQNTARQVLNLWHQQLASDTRAYDEAMRLFLATSDSHK